MVGLGGSVGIFDARPCIDPDQCAQPAQRALDKWRPDLSAFAAWHFVVNLRLVNLFHQPDPCHCKRKQRGTPTAISQSSELLVASHLLNVRKRHSPFFKHKYYGPTHTIACRGHNGLCDQHTPRA